MAIVHIELARIGTIFSREVEEVVELLNSEQKEFYFSIIEPSIEEKFQLLDFKEIETSKLIQEISNIRNAIKGYHPYIIAITNSFLIGKNYDNLFGDISADRGLAVFTFHNIPELIIPKTKIKSYIIYYLARYSFNFLIPDHTNHVDTRACVFDFKKEKKHILKSMKNGALCDQCRSVVTNPKYFLSATQFISINKMFKKSGDIISQEYIEKDIIPNKLKVFIGSSTEGLVVARKIQAELSHDFEITIWNQGIFDKLGLSYLEILEGVVNSFDSGIFVFTPDDTIHSRGAEKKIARDNVIFELGMFVGKLGRKSAYLVHPRSCDLHILTDFLGITKADYDQSHSNLQAALGVVCERIRTSIK